MIIIGTFIRGPGWQWFWPGQTWDHNRLIYEVNRDLPDIFGITSNMAKALFGAVVVGGYYLLGGFLVYSLFRRYMGKDFKRMSLLQFGITQFLLLSMVALPLKMALRLLWHIKYVWITPGSMFEKRRWSLVVSRWPTPTVSAQNMNRERPTTKDQRLIFGGSGA